ncbi:hypothetical protein A2Z23_02130 [Candidatus Curtissbacteria bacterium RBG_16_39_7]|uniref:Uncharacterized protein n=1 Tax=Candidatus Curtissbacteria bacterium RBG_16_39_7 TaxID=1797707 RepID=A0A1F5G203_9BACT|nr:MAG: hypothetical protein A2Z23_02130 [Candidatus Curtissbacteria bacterium RBG_16_39_7]
MERLKISEQTNERMGVSLEELVTYVIARREGKVGHPISKRVLWLSENMETEEFWLVLNRHMAEDSAKRQSVGGIFVRRYGRKEIGPYLWYQVFSSLDCFLKGLDMRATEFIFRDFQPKKDDLRLTYIINTTRQLALDKYPRIRRLYWDDYREMLETPSFWRGLAIDLATLDEPIAASAFFGWPDPSREESTQILTIREASRRIFQKRFWMARGQVGKRARLIEYHNLSQIVRDIFKKDPRTFLLSYTPESQSPSLEEVLNQAKKLIAEKISPFKPIPEQKTRMGKKEFLETVSSYKFWSDLATDIENHANSQNQAYSFSYFLRHYDRDENEIMEGRVGTYGRLTTIHLQTTRGLRRKMSEPGEKLVHFLMWKFKPSEDTALLVTKTKALCAEMFPNDCLYVILQTPEFWQVLQNDVTLMKGKHTLLSFLRYFSRNNPSCDRRRHHRGTSKYQRLLHRAYHKQEEFLQFLAQVGIENVTNYKDGLAKLFWHTAPAEVKPFLDEKFPQNFQSEQKKKQEEAQKLFTKAKNLLAQLKNSRRRKTKIEFQDKKEALKFRRKLWSAARSLKLPVSTRLKENQLAVSIRRLHRSQDEIAEFEEDVRRLRLKGWQNKDIARHFGVKDYLVEYATTKLIARGKISSRRNR